jgi:hypothetical protein
MVLDVCVHGRPISNQTSRRATLADWKRKVRAACAAAWSEGEPPISGLASLRVTYYYETLISDVDNLVKPIQDVLQGLAYHNDRQISDVIGRLRNIDGLFKARYMSAALATAFTDGREFVHIEVWRSPDREGAS